MKSFLAALTVAMLTAATLAVATPALAANTTYYVNNSTGSNCSDSGAGSSAQPWCSFTPVNAHGAFGPGDRILLARGATWNQELDLTGSGTAVAGITLDAYGAGAAPKILRNQGPNDLGIKLTSPDYWTINNLEVGKAAVGILVDYRTKNHTGLTIRSVNVHDNKGIMSGHDVNYPASGGTSDPWAAANDVNLAAGILVTALPSLSYAAGEYAAKNIVMDDIVGSHNLDSVAVTNESTGSGTAGVQTFQNVSLSSLRLSNDDAHAAAAYQAAGIGCPDSLRLIQVTNAIVRDSTLTNEAACHTATGTAAVFLAQVNTVTFVNNSFVGVPNTGSNDQTAIDFEYYEQNVTLRNNYFAANAGAGVEFLNIHNNVPADQTSALLEGNSFSYNDTANTVSAAGVYQLSGGGDSAIPTGTVKNSLYSEPNHTFLGGSNVSGLAATNNISVAASPIYAADQFSSTQGGNQWHYQSQNSTGAWADLPTYSTTTGPGGAWQTSVQQYVSAFRMAPVANTGEVGRVWVAPYPGTVSIRGRVLKADINDGVSAGNGVTAAIKKVSGTTTTQLWPTTGGAQVVAGTDQVGYATDLDSIQVNAGDQLRFQVGANGGDNAYDTASWSPSIAYTSSTTAYAWLFSTGLNFEGWSPSQANATVSGGNLNLTSAGADPFIVSQDNLGVSNPATERYLHINMRNQTSDSAGRIYFTTTASPVFSEDKSVPFTTRTNATGFTDYTIDMAANPSWTGTIKQLRVDPFSTTGVATIDSIRLQN